MRDDEVLGRGGRTLERNVAVRPLAVRLALHLLSLLTATSTTFLSPLHPSSRHGGRRA